MKKRTTVDLVEQSEKVSFYSISFQMDRTTEFERFLSKFEEEAEFNEDYQRILAALEIILDRGALNGISGRRNRSMTTCAPFLLNQETSGYSVFESPIRF